MDKLIIAGRSFSSRLMVGTGKFSSNETMVAAMEGSARELVTVALRRVDGYISQFYPDSALSWEGLTITSNFGYWSPISIMIIVGVIFTTLFAWLLFVNRKAQRVKQFNIVFAAERPYRPETTHFAWNFFAPYRKALGFLTQPLVTRFWETVADLLHSAADYVRRLYSGNGQTYAIHLLGFVVVVYLIRMGI